MVISNFRETEISRVRYAVVIFSVLMLLPLFVLGEASGSFTVVKGEITLISKSGEKQKAKVGLKVTPSDTITSGPDSRAKIVMSDKNIINISPDTKLTLQKYVFDEEKNRKEVALDVQYGKIRATVNQKYDGEVNTFHVKTPSAVAGVRGTDFITSFDLPKKETKVVTFEGQVAVGLPGANGKILKPVLVNPGLMTTALQGETPAPPSKVPPQEFSALKLESLADGKALSDNRGRSDSGPDKGRDPASEKKDGDRKDGGRANKGDKSELSPDGKSNSNMGPEGPNDPAKSDSASNEGRERKGRRFEKKFKMINQADFQPSNEVILPPNFQTNLPPIGLDPSTSTLTREITNQQIQQIIQKTSNPANLKINIKPNGP